MPIINKYYDAGYRAFDSLNRKQRQCPYTLISNVREWQQGWVTAETHLIEYERLIEEKDEENINRGSTQKTT